MTSLEKLGIEEMDGSSDGDRLLGSLVEFENLQQLTLRGFRFRSMPCLDELRALHELHTFRLDGLLARLPSKFPPSLERLTLVNSCLEEDPMPVLENLRPLQCMKLRNAYTGRQMVISDEGFQHLTFLCIQDMWNLRDVQVGDGAMKNLERVKISNCPYLETIPEEMGSMERLREVKMVTTKKVAKKIRVSGLISKLTYVDISP